jgi:ribosomal protein L29
MMFKRLGAVALVAAAAVALAACASQKEPAEQALAGIEKTLEGSGAQLQKYLPERYQEIEAKVQALREALAAERFGDVVSDAPAVVEELRRAVADSAIRRAQARVELEAEWSQLIKDVPAMVAAVDRKIAVQGGRPPQGMDRAGWKAMVDSYDASRAAWSKAAAEMSTANFESTVLAARDAKAKIAGVMEALGIQAS